MKLKFITVHTSAVAKRLLCMSLLTLTTACGVAESSIIREAKEAEKEERIINNELMYEMYPKSFRKGNPPCSSDGSATPPLLVRLTRC